MNQGLLKTLESIGKSASEKFIKSTYQNASVYFSLPLQVVKIEKDPPTDPVFAKLARHTAEALTNAYQAVTRKVVESKGKVEVPQILTVSSAEGDVTVVISGSMEILEIGTTLEPQNLDAAKDFMRSIVVAANAGYLKIQAEAAKMSAFL